MPVYMTEETRRQVRLNPGLCDVFNWATEHGHYLAMIDITDMTGPDGKLSPEATKDALRKVENSAPAIPPGTLSKYSDRIVNDVATPDTFDAQYTRSTKDLKTMDGQPFFLMSGNFTLQDPKTYLSKEIGIPKNKINMDALSQDSAGWDRFVGFHEIKHGIARHGESNTPELQNEIDADKFAIEQYAKDPEGRFDPQVPDDFMASRLLGYTFAGTLKTGMEAVEKTGTSVLMKQANGHDTYLGVTQGLSVQETGEVKARADAVVYSMATQAEITRLGGIEVFNREHPDMAGQVYQNPAEAFEGAQTLMEAQKNPSMINDPDQAPQVARALQNATMGARLVNENPALAYATVDAALQSDMVPDGSTEAGLMQDYKAAMEKYAPDYADADLGAEVAANFDNTVPKDAIAASNAGNFPQPEPQPGPAPEAQSAPAPENDTPPAPNNEKPPEPTYNSGTSPGWAPSFG